MTFLRSMMPLPTARAAFAGRIVAVAVLGGALLAAAILLWVRNGTAVFFETLAAGFSACF